MGFRAGRKSRWFFWQFNIEQTFNKTTDQNLKEINFMENQNQEKSKPAHNIRSYCMPLKASSKSICAIYGHFARRQNCINQSGSQHSAARYLQVLNIVQRQNIIWINNRSIKNITFPKEDCLKSLIPTVVGYSAIFDSRRNWDTRELIYNQKWNTTIWWRKRSFFDKSMIKWW